MKDTLLVLFFIIPSITEGQRIFVKEGILTMGCVDQDKRCDKDELVKKVFVGGFFIDEAEVTVQKFVEFLNKNNSTLFLDTLYNTKKNRELQFYKFDGKYEVKQGMGNLPVQYVTWYGAQEYAKSKGGELPSHEQWEYAARLQSRFVFSGSNDINDVGFHMGNSESKLQQVKQLKPNQVGIYDMSGNLFEYTSTKFKEKDVVIKGGSYNSPDEFCRISNIGISSKKLGTKYVGFRLVYSSSQ